LVTLATPPISSVNQRDVALVEVQSEQLTVLSGQSIAEGHVMFRNRRAYPPARATYARHASL
jgi:hypothetical protein